MNDNQSLFFGGLIIIVILFFAGRAITNWYFRINEQIALLTEIRDELKKRN